MTDIYATAMCPLASLDLARTIGDEQWSFTRALTTDPTGPSNTQAEITHYGSSGLADAALLALVSQLDGVTVNFTDTWQDALAAAGLYIIAEEI